VFSEELIPLRGPTELGDFRVWEESWRALRMLISLLRQLGEPDFDLTEESWKVLKELA